MKKDIDWKQVVGEDEMDETINLVKGVTAILETMELVNDAGGHAYDAQAYLSLAVVCRKAIGNLEAMVPKLDYMEKKMREG